jgi:hypothetical protein
MYINHANETAFSASFSPRFGNALFAPRDDDAGAAGDVEAPETKVVAILTACAMVLTFATALTAIVRAFE